MQNDSTNLNVIPLPSTLTLGSLLEGLSQRTPLFVPVDAKTDSSLMGWRLPESVQQTKFSSASMELTSASAMAAFGLLRTALNADVASRIPSETPDKGTWLSLLAGTMQDVGEWKTLSGGINATPTWLTDVTLRNDVKQRTDAWISLLAHPPEGLGTELHALLPILQRIISEALLNVHEHAYSSEAHKPVWLSATILPVSAQRQILTEDESRRGGAVACHPREVGWIDGIEGNRVLELAICDHGFGIPRTLAKNAAKRRPDLCERIAKLSAGTKEFAALRAELHGDICAYAFHHFSTRKEAHEFQPPFLQFHWRGLYRCYRQVVESGGGIALTSGQGRAGYTALGARAEAFRHCLGTASDFPGTLWNIRLPLPAVVRQRRQPSSPAGSENEMHFHEIIMWRKQATETPDSNVALGLPHASEPQLTAVTLPFCEVVAGIQNLQPDQIGAGELTEFLPTRIAEQAVPVFCFIKSVEDWRHHFCAIEPDAEMRLHSEGPPRLVGWMTFDGKLQCGVAGVVSEDNAAFIKQLEEHGEAHAESESNTRFAAELVAHYPQHLIWEEAEGILKVPFHAARISFDDHLQVLRTAWMQYWAKGEVREEVVTKKEGCAILLATGTRIRSHFSVFRMLHQSRLVTEALGSFFARKLATSLPVTSRPTVVIDQPASRHICHALLADTGCAAEVCSFDALANGQQLPSSVIVFADAILKGDTVGRVLTGLRRLKIDPKAVVTCADVRNLISRGKPILSVPVLSLVEAVGFDCEIITDPKGLRDIQTDSITHVPFEDAKSSPFVDLSCIPEVAQFLIENPELFACGYHRLSDRAHTVSLPLGGFVRDVKFSERLAAWAALEIQLRLGSLGVNCIGKDIVFFTRFDTKIGQIEALIARELDTALHGNTGVFRVRLPAAYREAHTVFPQASMDIFADCKEMTAKQLALGGYRKPLDKYVAIYLDDAAVTGNSMRDFVYCAMQSGSPTPCVIVAIAMVNRLSPGEVRFLQLCRNLDCDGEEDDSGHHKFGYCYLFNLQVRSHRQSRIFGHKLLDAVLECPRFFHPTLRPYVDSLRESTRAPLSKTPRRHLFNPDGAPEPVTTAVIQFRHLLALNQQNEPVILEIIRRLERLTDPASPDPSILTVFALEPSLLEDPPLWQFGREIIVRLAKQVLTGDYSVVRKSDALAVLACFPRALIEHYSDFGEAVLSSEKLTRQLVVHIMANLATSEANIHLPQLKPLPKVSEDRQFWFHRVLDTARKVERLTTIIHGPQEARNAIALLGSHLLPHTKSHDNIWVGLGESLGNLAKRWTDLADVSRRQHDLAGCKLLAAFAERIILPAYPALTYFLRRHSTPEDIESLRDAHALAHERLGEFLAILPSNIREFDKKRAEEADRRFRALKEVSWSVWTTDGLLSGAPLPQDASQLAKSIAKAFSAPSMLLERAIRTALPTAKPFSELRELRGKDRKLTVAPIPVDTLEYIYFQLLDNVAKCGDVNSLQILTELNRPPNGDFIWHVQIRNRVVKPKTPDGQGQGLQLAAEKGRQFGVVLQYGYENNNAEFAALLEIPRSFQLDQNQPKFEL